MLFYRHSESWTFAQVLRLNIHISFSYSCDLENNSYKHDPPKNGNFYTYFIKTAAIADGASFDVCHDTFMAVFRWVRWQTCGNGRRSRRRMVKTNARRGGRPCPRKLVQRRRCHDNPPCSTEGNSSGTSSSRPRQKATTRSSSRLLTINSVS